MLASTLNNKVYQIPNFNVSRTWIRKFKLAMRIRSRRILKFSTHASYHNFSQLKLQAEQFVNEVKDKMQHLSLSSVVNIDQTGCLKELHSQRTHRPIGTQRVDVVCQSANALTHSYTLMPLLYADGTLGNKSYLVIDEPTGSFPASGILCPDNLIIVAKKGHIMNNTLCDDFFRRVFWENDANVASSKLLLLLDSWAPFRNHQSIQQFTPSSSTLTICNIPPGTTSMAQPLDLGFFRPWKSFMRRIQDHVLIHALPFRVRITTFFSKAFSFIIQIFKFLNLLHLVLIEPNTLYQFQIISCMKYQLLIIVIISNQFYNLIELNC